MAQIDLKYYLLRGKVCTLALPISKTPQGLFFYTLIYPNQHRLHLE